tara:strand:+ start:19643 stop:20092 length:450 start_codon:yes stop_codon:yes gene_type:complete
MSSYYSGHNGKMYLNGDELARVANWSFSSSLNLLNTTALSDTDASSTPGIRSNNGACRIYFYRDADGSNDCSTLIKNLVKKVTTGTAPNTAPLPEKVRLKLFVDVGTGDGNYIEGDAYFQSVAMAMAIGEVLAADVQFQFTGALTGLVL